MEKLIAALFLVSCASTPTQVESAIKAVKSCEYLMDYADSVSDALNAKDYTLAINIAQNAYMKSLEDANTPCLEESKKLIHATEDFILDKANKEGVNE